MLTAAHFAAARIVEPMMPTILPAAQIAAEAEQRTAEAIALHAERIEAVALLDARLAAARSKYEAIVARRAERQPDDEQDEKDAAALQLIMSDANRLQDLRATAGALAESARLAVGECRAALFEANAELARKTAAASAAELEQRLRAIENIFVAGIATLDRLKHEAAGSNKFMPASTVYKPGRPLIAFVVNGVVPCSEECAP